jgi:primosomal protein N' (replication factor Y)
VSGVQVVVDVPLFHLDRPFTYRVPEPLRGAVLLGSRVKVPFGGRKRVDGWVVGFSDELPPGARDVIRLVSPLPAFGPRELALLRWVADRWAGTLADVLRLAVPQRVAAVEAALAAGDGGGEAQRGSTAPHGDRLAALVGRGWRGAVLWRPLPGEDRGARVVAMVEAALAAGRGALVITPELAAGSEVGDAVRKGFPDAADLSSDLPDRRRYRAWAELRAGRRQVAVGGRSAVLAPVRRLGLVVVDDEANRAHKEQRAPRYHARDVALLRASVEGATCVLSGTVPSAEAVAAVRAGRLRLLAPDRAVERRARPLVEVVDPFDQEGGPGAGGLHRRALAAVSGALDRGESAYVLVPRRGPAQPGAPRLRTAGQVAEELGRHLGGTPVWRLDREVLDPGEVPPWAGSGPGVIVGTVAGVKDHPPLTGCRTVVVVGADVALVQAEVRAAEEAYRTWSRAAGWCGPQGGAGRFVLQAREGAHHAVQALVRWDPAYFWRHELPRRVELGFPPARRLVLVEGPEPGEAPDAMAALQDALGPKAELVGPAAMGRGWRIIAKVEDAESAARALRPMLAEASRSGGPRISVDVEPLEVLAPAPTPLGSGAQAGER